MTRKEMIEEIARQAGCSKRLVRKRLFSRSAGFKWHPFGKSFLNANTDWLDKNVLRQNWKNGNKDIDPYSTPNTFDVGFFPSGCIVLFNVEIIDSDGYRHVDSIGARLHSR